MVHICGLHFCHLGKQKAREQLKVDDGACVASLRYLSVKASSRRSKFELVIDGFSSQQVTFVNPSVVSV